MVKANELMIGNYVLDVEPYNDFVKVQPHHIARLVENTGHVYRPIPLTPEILEKCGFVFNEKGNLGLEFPARMALIFNKGNVGELDFAQDNNRISFKFGHIKYLHQLQNLYFALTGLELDFTL